MASIPEIVRFLDSYQGMNDVQRTDPKTMEEVEKIKGLIEACLQTHVFAALNQAITLAEACQDDQWIKLVAQKAVPVALEMDAEDRDDLQPIFERYLGHKI